jgi:hypothetical protein
MGGSFTLAKMQHSDINHLAADGASNAIGSISEYESISRTDRAIMMLPSTFATPIRINALEDMLRVLFSLRNL